MGARPKQREGAEVGELSWGAQSRSHGPPEELRALADVVLSLHLLSPPWQGWEAAGPRDGSLPFAVLPTVLLAEGSQWQVQVRAGQRRQSRPEMREGRSSWAGCSRKVPSSSGLLGTRTRQTLKVMRFYTALLGSSGIAPQHASGLLRQLAGG